MAADRIELEDTERDPVFPNATPCRHVRDGSYEPYRRVAYWTAKDPNSDIMRRYRHGLVLCVKCWGVLTDFAEFAR